jgi:hypothetical protein
MSYAMLPPSFHLRENYDLEKVLKLSYLKIKKAVLSNY